MTAVVLSDIILPGDRQYFGSAKLKKIVVGFTTGSPSALFVGSGFRGHLVGNTRIISVYYLMPNKCKKS